METNALLAWNFTLQTSCQVKYGTLIYIQAEQTSHIQHLQTTTHIMYKYRALIAVQKSYYYYIFSGLCIAF